MFCYFVTSSIAFQSLNLWKHSRSNHGKIGKYWWTSYTLNNVTWRLSSLGIILSILDTHTLAELSIISKWIENKFWLSRYLILRTIVTFHVFMIHKDPQHVEEFHQSNHAFILTIPPSCYLLFLLTRLIDSISSLLCSIQPSRLYQAF